MTQFWLNIAIEAYATVSERYQLWQSGSAKPVQARNPAFIIWASPCYLHVNQDTTFWAGNKPIILQENDFTFYTAPDNQSRIKG